MKILIVGAGVSGLALSSFLKNQNHSVTIIDKRKNWNNEGYVLITWSNGLSILDKLKVGKKARSRSAVLTSIDNHDEIKDSFQNISFEKIGYKHEFPRIITRRDLHELLLSVAPKNKIKMGISIKSVIKNNVTFSNNKVEKFDLIVGGRWRKFVHAKVNISRK